MAKMLHLPLEDFIHTQAISNMGRDQDRAVRKCQQRNIQASTDMIRDMAQACLSLKMGPTAGIFKLAK